MPTARFPAHLTLIGSFSMPEHRSRPQEVASKPLSFPTAIARDELCDVATRHGLLDRLEVIGRIAPSAPLSFVVVRVYGLADLNAAHGREAGDDTLRAVAKELRDLTRPTDLVGRLTGSAFGLVLQGTGSTAAAAVEARVSYRLAKLDLIGLPIEVRVSAASGTGVNFEVLPLAAMDSFDDCG